MDVQKKSYKKEITLLLVTIFFCFLVAEIFIRIFWYPPQDKGYPQELHILDEDLGYKLSPLYSGNFPMKTYQGKLININSLGLRDQESTIIKNNSIFRILGLGDSVTFGSGVNSNETYLGLLEENLKKEGHIIEILNAGVSGYEFNQEYIYFNKTGYLFEPDLVIIGVVLNDINEANISRIKENMLNFGYYDRPKDAFIEKTIKTICYSCTFIYSIVNNYNKRYIDKIYERWTDEILFESYARRMKEMNSYLQRKNSKMVIVLFPYTDQFTNSRNIGTLPQDKIKGLATKENIEVIDLMSSLDKKDYRRFYISGDNLHLSEEGNTVAAETIKQYLLEKKLIQ